MKEMLHPQKALIKKIRLQRMIFLRKSFWSFIDYVSRNYSLNELFLEDIWEKNGRKEYEICDPMSYWYNPQPAPSPSIPTSFL
jgi:hypothetical protein